MAQKIPKENFLRNGSKASRVSKRAEIPNKSVILSLIAASVLFGMAQTLGSSFKSQDLSTNKKVAITVEQVQKELKTQRKAIQRGQESSPWLKNTTYYQNCFKYSDQDKRCEICYESSPLASGNCGQIDPTLHCRYFEQDNSKSITNCIWCAGGYYPSNQGGNGKLVCVKSKKIENCLKQHQDPLTKEQRCSACFESYPSPDYTKCVEIKPKNPIAHCYIGLRLAKGNFGCFGCNSPSVVNYKTLMCEEISGVEGCAVYDFELQQCFACRVVAGWSMQPGGVCAKSKSDDGAGSGGVKVNGEAKRS